MYGANSDSVRRLESELSSLRFARDDAERRAEAAEREVQREREWRHDAERARERVQEELEASKCRVEELEVELEELRGPKT